MQEKLIDLLSTATGWLTAGEMPTWAAGEAALMWA